MAEECGGHDHAGVIAATKDFEIGAAGEGSANLDDELAGRGPGNRHVLDANIFAAMEDGGLHGAAPVKKCMLDRFAAQPDGSFNFLAAFDDDGFDSVEANSDDRFDGIEAGSRRQSRRC